MISTYHQVAPQPWFGEDGVLSIPKLLDYILEESHCAMIDCLLYVVAGTANVRELLFQASRKGNILLVNYMLSKRIFPQISSTIGLYLKVSAFEWANALELAVAGDHMEVMDALLAVLSDTDVYWSLSALQCAVKKRQSENG
jgi:hypothetical protein